MITSDQLTARIRLIAADAYGLRTLPCRNRPGTGAVFCHALDIDKHLWAEIWLDRKMRELWIEIT